MLEEMEVPQEGWQGAVLQDEAGWCSITSRGFSALLIAAKGVVADPVILTIPPPTELSKPPAPKYAPPAVLTKLPVPKSEPAAELDIPPAPK